MCPEDSEIHRICKNQNHKERSEVGIERSRVKVPNGAQVAGGGLGAKAGNVYEGIIKGSVARGGWLEEEGLGGDVVGGTLRAFWYAANGIPAEFDGDLYMRVSPYDKYVSRLVILRDLKLVSMIERQVFLCIDFRHVVAYVQDVKNTNGFVLHLSGDLKKFFFEAPTLEAKNDWVRNINTHIYNTHSKKDESNNAFFKFKNWWSTGQISNKDFETKMTNGDL